MRISDWSSDVCSSDLPKAGSTTPSARQSERCLRRSASALARASCAPTPPPRRRSPCGWRPRAIGDSDLAPPGPLPYIAQMTTKTVTDSNAAVIENRSQLIDSFARGEKPKERWRIGTEHEKFVYAKSDLHAPSYDEPGGIRDLLTGLTEFGWQPVEEAGKITALTGPDGAISLGPAGQFELSGAPLDNLHETCAEAARHLEQVKAVGDRLGLGFLGLGMWPDKARADLPVMPKGRYAIMLRHMPRVGDLGLDMMLRTCTIQVNLDYAAEADMAKKFRVDRKSVV